VETGVPRGWSRGRRAAAGAHRAPATPITTHTHAGTQRGLDQQRIFVEEGVDLRHVVIGHSGDTTDLDYLKQLMDAGSTIGMDRFGVDVVLPFTDRVDTVVRLCEQGYADRMVLAHDASCFIDWFDPDLTPAREAFAPQWHFRHIHDDVLPALRERGVTDGQIDQMLVDNPRRMLTPTSPY
jgi:phosphotriesterase-related protein